MEREFLLELKSKLLTAVKAVVGGAGQYEYQFELN